MYTESQKCHTYAKHFSTEKLIIYLLKIFLRHQISYLLFNTCTCIFSAIIELKVKALKIKQRTIRIHNYNTKTMTNIRMVNIFCNLKGPVFYIFCIPPQGHTYHVNGDLFVCLSAHFPYSTILQILQI